MVNLHLSSSATWTQALPEALLMLNVGDRQRAINWSLSILHGSKQFPGFDSASKSLIGKSKFIRSASWARKLQIVCGT